MSVLDKFHCIIFQEKICEESSSFDLTSSDLATAMEELSRLSENIYEMTKHDEQSLVEMTDSSSMPGKIEQFKQYVCNNS